MIVLPLVLVANLAILAPLASLDEIKLDNGRVLVGKVLVDDDRWLILEAEDGRRHTLPRERVLSVTRSEPEVEKPGDEQTEAGPRRRTKEFGDRIGVPLSVTSTQNVVVATNLGDEYTRELANTAERTFQRVAAVLRREPELAWVGDEKLFAVVLDERDQFGEFCQYFASLEPKVDSRWADNVSAADGFYWWDPTGTSATWKGGARGLDLTTAQTVHNLVHVLLNRHGYNFKFLPPWFDESFAALIERDVLKQHRVTCLLARRYGGAGEREDKLNIGFWFERIVEQMRAGEDPSIDSLLRKDYSTLELADIAKGMALQHYLLSRRWSDYERFFAALREHWPKGVVALRSSAARAAHKAAFEALGSHPVELDRDVRAHYEDRDAPEPGSKIDGP